MPVIFNSATGELGIVSEYCPDCGDPLYDTGCGADSCLGYRCENCGTGCDADLDDMAEAFDDLGTHDTGCAECSALLPDGECEARKELKARWKRRREIREAARMVAVEAVRRGSPDYGSPGGQMTAEEPAR